MLRNIGRRDGNLGNARRFLYGNKKEGPGDVHLGGLHVVIGMGELREPDMRRTKLQGWGEILEWVSRSERDWMREGDPMRWAPTILCSMVSCQALPF